MLDREYLTQDNILELGERFGPGGPLVLLALILERGKAQRGAAPGEVAIRYRALARLAWITVEQARDVVHALIELGLLVDVDGDGERFRAILAKSAAWDAKDTTAAERKRKQRAREEHDDDDDLGGW